MRFIFAPIVLLSATALGQSPIYRVTNLGTLGGHSSGSGGINGAATVVGSSLIPGGLYSHAFAYDAGNMHDLGTFNGDSEALGINDSGQIVGWSDKGIDDDMEHAALWAGGTLSDLGTLGGSQSHANGINASGQIVGDAYLAGDSTLHAFLYSSGAMTDIGTLGGTSSVAYGINSSGTVVGGANTAGGYSHAFLFSNGSMADLGVLPGGLRSWALGVTSAGQVAGYSEARQGFDHAFLYSQGAMHDLGTLGGTESWGLGINSTGVVVGVSFVANGAEHGFVYAEGSMADLNAMTDSSAIGLTIVGAGGISDHGAIAADAKLDNGQYRAVLLTPYFVDYPATYSITAGKYISGNLASLDNADQNYLIVQSGPSFSNGSPPLSIVLTGTSTVAAPTDVRLNLTGHVDSVDLQQTVEMYDYVAAAWVVVSTAAGTTSDSTQVAISANPGRFVQSGTLQMKARLSWKPVGPISKSPWSAYIDQAVWNVSP